MKQKILSQNLLESFDKSKQIFVFSAILILSFFVPFVLGHPQWIVGIIVNACLFLGAIYLPKKYFVSLAILPSLGVLSRGLIFGSLTLFLVYFLPFIWLGNLFLILVSKNAYASFYKQKIWNNSMELSYVVSVVVASVLKFLFLFIIANIYFKINIVPVIFLQAMGLNQLATALGGGLMSFLIWKIYLQKQKS